MNREQHELLLKIRLHLKGWNDTQFHYRPHKNSGGSVDYLVQYRMGNYQSILGDVYPAYTLGELLRKLPDAGIAKVGEQYNSWSQSYDKAHFDDYEDAVCSDDTPEDSLGKLAIKLLE